MLYHLFIFWYVRECMLVGFAGTYICTVCLLDPPSFIILKQELQKAENLPQTFLLVLELNWEKPLVS